MSQRTIFALGVLVGSLFGAGTCAVAQQAADCGKPCEIVIAPEMCEPFCPEDVDCQLCAEECEQDCPELACPDCVCPLPPCECACPPPCCPEPRVRIGEISHILKVPTRYDLGAGLGARDTATGSTPYAVVEFSWRPTAGLWGLRVGLTGDLEDTDLAKPHPEYGWSKTKRVEDKGYGAHVLAVRSW